MMSGAQAIASSDLLIEFKTDLYEESGSSNAFTISLGSVEGGTSFQIDCGFGKQSLSVDVAELDSAYSIIGTSFTGSVSEEGMVRVYGDPSKLDYFNGSGCSITGITFHDDLNLQLLNLEHNSLGKINLEEMDKLQVLYIMDNPFDEEPFDIKTQKDNLAILEIGELGNINPDFDFNLFPNLMSVDAYYTRGLKTANTSNCPNLYRLSLEMTDVESVNVSKNQNLMVLNVSDSRVSSLDLNTNAELLELYCTHGSGSINPDVKFTELDVTNNTKLEYLFCGGNALTSLDLSKNTNLLDLSTPYNQLTSLDINATNNPQLINVNIANNLMNFNTLPLPVESWSEYYYYQQDLVIDDTYREGDILDFSDQVLRNGTTTTAKLYSLPKEDPTNMQELDSTYYTFDNGMVTLLKATSEKLCLEFSNSMFSIYPLYTEPFTVCSPEEYGKDKKALSISSMTAEGDSVLLAIGIVGATDEEPGTISIDLGDGNLLPINVTSEIPAGFNIRAKRKGNGNIDIYVPQDRYISALKSSGLSISNLAGITELSELRVLSLVDAQLYSIDLSYNAKLEELTLTGNTYLTTVDLKGMSNYYYKGRLAKVNLSHNHLSTFTYDDLYAIRTLDLSHNNLAEFDATDADYIKEIDLSDNHLDFLQFNNSTEIEKIVARNNNLYYIYVPEEAPLAYLDVTGNIFAYGYMPENHWNLDDEHYLYAPQQNIVLPEESPVVNLSAYYLEEGDNVTTFVWKDGEGNLLTEGTDYSMTYYGLTQFSTDMIGKQVYCELSHPSYPQFAGEKVLRTTVTTIIDAPTIELASFTTTEDYDVANVILKATKPGTSIYIDWGDGVLDQYNQSGDDLMNGQAYTYKGAKVRVLVTNEEDNISVFSLSGATMSSFDGSKLTEAILIGVENAGLSSITLPLGSTQLKELKLSGNKFTELDLTQLPSLYYLAANNNLFESFDFSQAPGLGLAFLAANKLSSVSFDNNNALWNLDLGCNKFSEINFEGAPNIEQLWLNSNQFETVDFSYLTHLKVLDIVDNYLTFATIPTFSENPLNVYRYDNQADIEVFADGNQVDISSQAEVEGVATQYRWFVEKPEYDDDQQDLVGDELVSGEDFIVEYGVTTFFNPEKTQNLVCAMTNEVLPSLTLYSLPVNIEVSAIEQLSTSANTSGKEFRNGSFQIRRNAKVFDLLGR